MIQTMTGYGRSTKQNALGSVTVELRSTNHRYLEIDQRLPNGLVELQGRVAELLKQRLRRGRVEVVIALHLERAGQRRVTLDEPLLQRYHEALIGLKGRFGLKGSVTLDHLLGLPQALTVSEDRLPAERLWELIRQAAQSALRELIRSRQREGVRLAADLRRQLRLIEQHTRAITRRIPSARAQQRQRLSKRLQEVLGNSATWSRAQLEQAVALTKETDVNEELVRLESHLAYMGQSLKDGQLVGKRLDFIAQELMREVNTLGAKANDPEAVQRVVEIKECVERIREQVQNLE